jgi:hypothetical protein
MSTRGGGLIARRGCECSVVAISACVRCSDDDVVRGVDRRQLRPRLVERVDHRRAGNDGRRLRIAQQCDETGSAKQRTQRHRHEPELRAGAIRLEQLDTIRQNDRDLVSLLEPKAEKGIRQPVHRRVVLREGEPPRAADDREMLRSKSCVARE